MNFIVALAWGLVGFAIGFGTRRLTVWRMRRGENAQLPLTHRMLRKLAGPGLQLLGIAWLGAGILALTVALPSLV